VLPVQQAEALLQSLPGVLSARIVTDPTGEIGEVHVLTTAEVSPKQTVRNVESALIAQLGLRVSHKKISVAMTNEAGRPRIVSTPEFTPILPMPVVAAEPERPRRRLYFEDIEVRRSRTRGVTVRVTLRSGEREFVGEAEGVESERLRLELAARATLQAIAHSGEQRVLGLEGYRLIDAFDREFVFVGISTRQGRESRLLTGSAEVRETPETASVLAVLDATNRWLEYAP
jgi:hypothetical protein